ncbi:MULTISPECIES: hypothetical protein [unclassified Bradyrhizobium]|uniref:hypothetical protein n=1 Tax=unclassified Bradyrhizobium TaxID=2631580 RepID=UPI00247A7505|nr:MULTISPECIES: hypothetical protein [unclassified Bradyrhizobium]WGS18944.1 hypothetical protein MTX22_31195 [Bradyrhizobium sp. ISRA463]WGS25777.1 hypothetical protein MTX19_28765 [Bradyrhizobium sp. ISRA464]
MSRLKDRIRSLEVAQIDADRSKIFTMCESDGRIMSISIWGRSKDGQQWPADEKFDPPIERDHLPEHWLKALAKCPGQPMKFDLAGVFGGMIKGQHQ